MSRLSAARAARLPAVRRLSAQGLSQRDIAARLRVSQSAIARDMQELKKERRAMATDSPESPTGPDTDSPESPPGDSTDSAALDRVADAQITDSAGGQRRLTLDTDPDLIRDLVDLMDGTGCGPQQLVAYAVSTLAAAYRTAREHGALRPEDELAVIAVTIRRPCRDDSVVVTFGDGHTHREKRS